MGMSEDADYFDDKMRFTLDLLRLSPPDGTASTRATKRLAASRNNISAA